MDNDEREGEGEADGRLMGAAEDVEGRDIWEGDDDCERMTQEENSSKTWDRGGASSGEGDWKVRKEVRRERGVGEAAVQIPFSPGCRMRSLQKH